LLEGHKISRSMSAKGCCGDNAVVEDHKQQFISARTLSTTGP
jgi:hypothetical protein